jgi:hypothetical protein
MANFRRSPLSPPLLVVTALLLATVLPGCDLSGNAAITVTIPPLPGVYARGTVVWTVRWWDGATLREIETATSRGGDDAIAGAAAGSSLGDGGGVTLSLPLSSAGAEVVIVTAEARVEPGIPLKPYGGWARAPVDSVVPTRALGVTAEVLLQLAAAGIDPSLINVERLAAEVVEECGDDPAALDRERLVEALGTLEMRRYAIRRRERRGCEISLPGEVPTPWISDDPSHPVIDGVVAAERCYWVVPVGEGEVRYLRRPAISAAESSSAPATAEWEILTVGRDAAGHAFWYLRRAAAAPLPDAGRVVPAKVPGPAGW